MDVISLTRDLLSFNNINPPGNEEEIARFAGKILVDNGFQTEYYIFDEGRLHLIAERGLSDAMPPLFCPAISILFLLAIKNGV